MTPAETAAAFLLSRVRAARGAACDEGRGRVPAPAPPSGPAFVLGHQGPVYSWVMALSGARARELLLRFGDVSAAQRLDRTAFGTSRWIFATLANDGRDVDFLMLDWREQETLYRIAPAAFEAPGRPDKTRCNLEKVDEPTFVLASEAAYFWAGLAPHQPTSDALTRWFRFRHDRHYPRRYPTIGRA